MMLILVVHILVARHVLTVAKTSVTLDVPLATSSAIPFVKVSLFFKYKTFIDIDISYQLVFHSRCYHVISVVSDQVSIILWSIIYVNVSLDCENKKHL